MHFNNICTYLLLGTLAITPLSIESAKRVGARLPVVHETSKDATLAYRRGGSPTRWQGRYQRSYRYPESYSYGVSYGRYGGGVQFRVQAHSGYYYGRPSYVYRPYSYYYPYYYPYGGTGGVSVIVY